MKKFIVTINSDWNVVRFKFSTHDEAFKFMHEAFISSVGQVICKLEVLELEDITNEEKQDN